MGRKPLNTPEGAPPVGAGGAGYRKRAGKVGLTVSVTPEEREVIRRGAFDRGLSMSAYLVALAHEAARGRSRRPKPEEGS